ncbi:putative F-box domain-containing protein [Rosa chinensis]|uniref:Putative F-box domain-containing protein n=2 Tax=Rosa chinensis TaxID=74649 RepID=A0A2P6RQ03_ROSCH|nr:F-box/kelch-repeat protein At3g06240 isoform X1 [Rosa chinensis]PRQ48525.1 putative F-box domain-containing protein [Rosa chinensis]
MANCTKLHVSEEIVEQILSRLPPKSLMRFKCVCTLWWNLIQSPSFVAKHLSNSLRASSSVSILCKHTVEKKVENNDHAETGDDVETLLSSLYLCNEIDDLVAEVLRVPPPMNQISRSSDLRIAGHCDGITCLKFFVGNVVLCNPAIKEFKLLPKSCLLLPSDNDEYLDLELRYYTEFLGFGYDRKGKDYKVVRFVVYEESCYWFRAEVYTLGSNSWREVETEYTYREFFVMSGYCDQQMFFEGIYYWQVCGQVGECILSFDMGDEIFNVISIPWEEMPDEYHVRLGKWKESIALISCPTVTVVPQSFDIWVMNNSGNVKGSWTKCLTIGPMEGVEIPLLYAPLVFWKSDELLMVAEDGSVVSYNLEKQTVKYLPIHFVGDYFHTQAVVYVNSTVSINGGNKLEGIDNTDFYGINALGDGRLRAV